MRFEKRIRKLRRGLPWLALGAVLLYSALHVVQANAGFADAVKNLNPCAAKTINPCAAKTLNPCAAKTLNPCTARTLNPCTAKTLNPCTAKGMNPCGGKMNPCGGASVEASRFQQPAGQKLAGGRSSDLIARGNSLWNDRTLGKSGLACASCHINDYALMQSTFAKPYPHHVAMPHQQAGVDQVNAAEMVQFCMLVPMMGEPLPWGSRELAALTAYVESIRSGYHPVKSASANPCNPCSMKRNPCNPCGGRR